MVEFSVQCFDAFFLDFFEQSVGFVEPPCGSLASDIDGHLVNRAVLAELLPEPLARFGRYRLEQHGERLRQLHTVIDDLGRPFGFVVNQFPRLIALDVLVAEPRKPDRGVASLPDRVVVDGVGERLGRLNDSIVDLGRDGCLGRPAVVARRK